MNHNLKRINLSKEAKLLKRKKDEKKIADYKTLTDQILHQNTIKNYEKKYLPIVGTLLQWNPEFYTAWNYRRRVLISLFRSNELNKKDALEQDLQLVLGLLKRFPKCYWIWNHRVWCLMQLASTNEANWDLEFKIVSKLLEADSRNYHGWQYRRFVVENLKHSNGGISAIEILKLDLQEFRYTTSKISNNISNFSAWHNRSKIIPRIFRSIEDIGSSALDVEGTEIFKTPIQTLNHELDIMKTGLYMDCDDSSVWLYLAWILTNDVFSNAARESGTYEEILKSQLALVSELNDLEKSDDLNNKDNIWCLKTMVLLRGLLNRERLGIKSSNLEILDADIKEMLEKLIVLDYPRHIRYSEQITGNISVIS